MCQNAATTRDIISTKSGKLTQSCISSQTRTLPQNIDGILGHGRLVSCKILSNVQKSCPLTCAILSLVDNTRAQERAAFCPMLT